MKQYRILEQLSKDGDPTFWVQELKGCWPFRSWDYTTQGEAERYVMGRSLSEAKDNLRDILKDRHLKTKGRYFQDVAVHQFP